MAGSSFGKRSGACGAVSSVIALLALFVSLVGAAGGSAADEQYTDPTKEVYRFLVRYSQAYEEGDITKFMGFFSRSATENGALGYEDIKSSYGENFRKSRFSYTLRNVRVTGKDGSVTATADYSIRRISGEERGQPINGKIRWTLVRENGDLRIIRMDHTRDQT